MFGKEGIINMAFESVYGDLNDIFKMAQERRLRVEIVMEPDHYGAYRQQLTVEPWQSFEPRCPYADQFVFVGKKEE